MPRPVQNYLINSYAFIAALAQLSARTVVGLSSWSLISSLTAASTDPLDSRYLINSGDSSEEAVVEDDTGAGTAPG